MTNEVTGARPAGSDDRLDVDEQLRVATRPGRVRTARVCGAVTVLAGVAAAVDTVRQGAEVGGINQFVWSILAVLFLLGSGLTTRTLWRYPSAGDLRADRAERVREVIVRAAPWPYVLTIAFLIGIALAPGSLNPLAPWVPAAFVAIWVPGIASLAVPLAARDWDDAPLVAPLLAPGAGRRLARAARVGQALILFLAVVLVAVVVTAVVSLRAPGGSLVWTGLAVAGALVQAVALFRTARAAGVLHGAVEDEHIDREAVGNGPFDPRVTIGVAVLGAVLVVVGGGGVVGVLAGPEREALTTGIPRFGPTLVVAFAPVWLATWLPDRVRVLTGITRRGRPPEQAGRSEARQDTRAE